MSKAEHTPGPWRVFTAKPPNNHKIIGIGELSGEGIADCGFGVWRGGSAEALANARLIAAAPDMLEALRHVEAIMEIVPPRNSTAKYIAGLHMVRAAIRKALGHSDDRPADSAAAQGQPETK